MARAISGMKGGILLQKINWLAAEGSSWKLVRPLIADNGVPPEQKTELYPQKWARSFFTDICDDDEMEEAVKLLSGSVEQKLNWMLTGTNAKAVFRARHRHGRRRHAVRAARHYLRHDEGPVQRQEDYEHARDMLNRRAAQLGRGRVPEGREALRAQGQGRPVQG